MPRKSKKNKNYQTHVTLKRKNRKTMRKGGGKDSIIRGERKDFQRILNTIKSQYEFFAHSTKGVVFNDKIKPSCFVMTLKLQTPFYI